MNDQKLLNFKLGQEIFLFSKASRLALGPMQPPIQMGIRHTFPISNADEPMKL
jgi:hypothetical protein